MSRPWGMIDPDDIEIVSPDGETRCRVKGYFSGTQFVIDDMKADVRPGDEIRRQLPNGNDDVFYVVDPKFYKNGPFGAHYQIKISRLGTFAHKTGGHYSIHVSGNNSRVNVSSSDNSVNFSGDSSLWAQLNDTITNGVSNDADRRRLTVSVAKIEHAKDQRSFSSAYAEFVSLAADHMTLLAPFIPAIASLLSQLPT